VKASTKKHMIMPVSRSVRSKLRSLDSQDSSYRLSNNSPRITRSEDARTTGEYFSCDGVGGDASPNGYFSGQTAGEGYCKTENKDQLRSTGCGERVSLHGSSASVNEALLFNGLSPISEPERSIVRVASRRRDSSLLFASIDADIAAVANSRSSLSTFSHVEVTPPPICTDTDNEHENSIIEEFLQNSPVTSGSPGRIPFLFLPSPVGTQRGSFPRASSVADSVLTASDPPGGTQSADTSPLLTSPLTDKDAEHLNSDFSY
jgi:hypothetical protein